MNQRRPVGNAPARDVHRSDDTGWSRWPCAGGQRPGHDQPANQRRTLLRAAASGGVAAAVGPMLWRQPAQAGSPFEEQVHLQFGSDAAREMTATWATDTSVARPRIRLGTRDGGLGSVIEAETSAKGR